MSQPPQGPPPKPPQDGGGAPGPSDGSPGPTDRGGRGRSRPRRAGILVGAGAVLLLALVAGGVWSATAFFGTGAQPAEALPADTLAYVAVDLDPGGGQKLEALRTLEKFPIIADSTDLDSDTDLKATFFDLARESEGCEALSYDEDLAPWLGDRFGFAAVPGEDEPSLVGVVQVTDAGAAEDGLRALANCAATGDAEESGESDIGFVVGGGWAVIAEDESIAQGVVDEAGEASLAVDDAYERWIDAAGAPGVLSAYAAPALADELGEGTLSALVGSTEDFAGAAATVRFADEGLELEAVGFDGPAGVVGPSGADVEAVVAGLPADTGALLALGFEGGWAEEVLEQISGSSGLSAEQLAAEAAAELGIEVPEDVETLLGDGAAVAVSSDIDLEGLLDGSTPPEEAPVGIRVRTDDPEASERVLDELRGALTDDRLLASETDGELLVVAPDAGYRSALLEDGDLADVEKFADAVPELARSGSVAYVDLDVLDDYAGLINLLSGEDRLAENLQPLAALGVSGWVEDDVSHALVRLSTDPD